MAIIKPFRGMRFNKAKIPELSQVVSQPYDRVRYGLQEKYYDLNPYNIVRIIRGKELPDDVPDRLEGPNVYTRGKAYYDLWRIEQVLAREEKPALYAYHQTSTVRGETKTRKGFITAFELSGFDEGVVLPHERTHAGPKVDRLRLLRTTQVNFGQIFMLYPDAERKIEALFDLAIAGREPDIDVVEMFEKDVRQQVWAVTDEETIRAVQEEMAPKRNLIIADGHHRYETALNYRNQMCQQYPDAPPEAAFRYRMVTMVSMDDPGLVILPTHRELLDLDVTAADVLQRAAPYFDVFAVADLDACLDEMKTRQEQHAFGLYANGQYRVLVLQDPQLIDKMITQDRLLAWKSLDVSILHKILLEQVVGLPEESVERCVRYHRDPALPVQNVDAGEGDMVFFLNPTRIEQVKECAEHEEKMPQKSTDFYPKVITGLTMMPVGPEERL